MTVIAKLPEGVLKANLMRLWRENDRLNRVGGNVSAQDKLSSKQKKEKLIIEANQLLWDYKSGIVHEVRSGLEDTGIDKKILDALGSAVKLVNQSRDNKLKWAADLKAVDDDATESSRPTSASGSATRSFEVSASWAVGEKRKAREEKKPQGKIPEKLQEIISSMVPGQKFDCTLKPKFGKTVKVVGSFIEQTETGMLVSSCCTDSSEMQYTDPSRIATIEVGTVPVEARTPDHTAGIRTPPGPTNIAGFHDLLIDKGMQVWAWAAAGEDAEDTKYVGETFWHVIQDVQYITWVYTRARTRPVCWKEFRAFRQAVLKHEAYTSMFGHYKSEGATLKALNEFVESFAQRLEHGNYDAYDDDAPNSEAAEIPEDIMEDVE